MTESLRTDNWGPGWDQRLNDSYCDELGCINTRELYEGFLEARGVKVEGGRGGEEEEEKLVQ